jgi:REP element-mobilizing transposase RayT
MGHPPRIPVWLRWEQSVVYFITICVANRKPVLANERAFAAFENAASRLRDWTVLAAVLMPDHLHFVAAPTEDREAKLGNCVAAIKRWMRQELNASWKWQRGSFDRLLRSDEIAARQMALCRRKSGPRRFRETRGRLAVSLRLQRPIVGRPHQLPSLNCRATASVATSSPGKRCACPTKNLTSRPKPDLHAVIGRVRRVAVE